MRFSAAVARSSPRRTSISHTAFAGPGARSCWSRTWLSAITEPEQARSGRQPSAATGSGSAAEPPGAPFSAWATDLLQSFRALLDIAAGLTRLPSAGTDAETGTPLLNLYLVVCALDQILCDYLHGGFFDFTRVGLGGRARRPLSIASRAQNTARQLQVRTMLRSLQATEANLSDLALELARQVLSGATCADTEAGAAVERFANRRFPAGLLRARLKLPQSFRGVELHPEDCALLGMRAHAIVGAEPVAVVGVRT